MRSLVTLQALGFVLLLAPPTFAADDDATTRAEAAAVRAEAAATRSEDAARRVEAAAERLERLVDRMTAGQPPAASRGTPGPTR